MTTKDYKAIAAALFKHTTVESGYSGPTLTIVWDMSYLAEDLADYMAADNPRFNRDKFIKACNGET